MEKCEMRQSNSKQKAVILQIEVFPDSGINSQTEGFFE